MKNEIAYWLKQIVEDDPVPDEIKYIVFILNNRTLSVGGYEILPQNVYQPEFYPLEAQYVFYNNLYNISDEKTRLEALCIEIDEAFYDIEIKLALKNKKIYVARFSYEPIFLFDA